MWNKMVGLSHRRIRKCTGQTRFPILGISYFLILITLVHCPNVKDIYKLTYAKNLNKYMGEGKGRSENARPERNLFKNRERKTT